MMSTLQQEEPTIMTIPSSSSSSPPFLSPTDSSSHFLDTTGINDQLLVNASDIIGDGGITDGKPQISFDPAAPTVSDSDSSLTTEDGMGGLFDFASGMEDLSSAGFEAIGNSAHQVISNDNNLVQTTSSSSSSSSTSWLHPAPIPSIHSSEDTDFTRLLDELGSADDSDSDYFLQEHDVHASSSSIQDYMNAWKCNPPVRKKRRLAVFIRR
eukprot:scaffold1060_cov109-Cylindrotheca_fusiformis.AAC.4